MRRILFLCTGNTCRSPMAQAFLSEYAHKSGLKVAVRSAGLSTIDGLPVSDASIESLRKKGIKHRGSSLSMNEEALQWADLILTMTVAHKRELLRRYPDATDKVYTVKEYAYLDMRTQQQIEQVQMLYAELQMQYALGQAIDEQKRQQLIKLELQMPELDYDIVDPFGGTQATYDACANELEAAIESIVDKLAKEYKR